jgi:cytochrome c553
MVAFLLEYPQLDAAAYRRLVHGDAPASDQTSPLSELARTEPSPTSLSASCARCHGNDGHGRGLAAFPKLAGQRAEYIFNALLAYAHGRRSSALMQPIAAGLSQGDMRQLAHHYARLPSAGRDAPVFTAAAGREHEPAPHARHDAIERGREIAARGLPDQGVPACSACHGPKPTRRNPAYPLLAGQYREYLTLQLQLLAGKRGGSSYVHVMHKTATRLSAEQMQQVASYYASLPGMGHE